MTPPKFETLEELYAKVNPKICADFDLHATTPSDPTVALHLLAAPANSGKSTFLRGLKKKYSGGEFSRLILHIPLDKIKDHLPVESRVDLKSNTGDPKVELSGMVATKGQDPIDFNELCKSFDPIIEADKASCIIVDSMDEVHPETTLAILDSIIRYTKARESAKLGLCILVVGRPETFCDFSTRGPGPRPPRVTELTLPHFGSPGDIRLSTKLIAKDNLRPESDAIFVADLAISNPLIRESAQIIGLQAELIRGVADIRNSNTHQINEMLFNYMLKRNASTHGRPNSDSLLYIELMRQIALKYADKVDESGFFSVKYEDFVQVKHPNKNVPVDFSVSDVLKRSGLAYLRPVDFSNPSFRFYPTWLHKYLAQRPPGPYEVKPIPVKHEEQPVEPPKPPDVPTLRTEAKVAFIFGVIFITILFLVSIVFPNLNSTSKKISDVILALSASGIGAMIPGIFSTEIHAEPTKGTSLLINATGASVLFLLVYFRDSFGFLPNAQSVNGSSPNNRTSRPASPTKSPTRPKKS